MPTTVPPVSLVMPARNDAAHLTDAVRAALAQDYPGPMELIVAVGPSDDETRAVANDLATDERVRVIENPTGGTAAGLNAAIAAASGSIIARVDAHCALPRGYVSRAVATVARTGAVNVGGVQHAVGATPFQRAVAAAMSSRFGVGDARFHYGGSEGPTDTVYLGVFDAAALEAVGGFDERLVRNQDYELNIRLRDAGGVVWFDPGLVVDYHPRSSLRSLARQYFQYGQWKREVVRRHPGSTRARQLVAPATVAGIVAGSALAATGRRWGLLAPLTYAAATVVASASTTVDHAGDRRHLLCIYPAMHLPWGVGFLLGPQRAEPGTTASGPRGTRLAGDQP